MPRFADYAAFWCLQNASFREEKFTATYGSRARSRVGLNGSSHQSDGEHGGLGAPAPLNKKDALSKGKAPYIPLCALKKPLEKG